MLLISMTETDLFQGHVNQPFNVDILFNFFKFNEWYVWLHVIYSVYLMGHVCF